MMAVGLGKFIEKLKAAKNLLGRKQLARLGLVYAGKFQRTPSDSHGI